MYVKDVGNGKTSLDELSFFTDYNADCLVTSDPGGEPFVAVEFGAPIVEFS